MEELPRDLEGDECLAGAGRQGKEDAFLPFRDSGEDPLDGDVLVVPSLEVAATVFEGNGGEAVAPRLGSCKGLLLERFRCWEVNHRRFPLSTGLHIVAVEAVSVARVGEANLQLAGVVLGLGDAF